MKLSKYKGINDINDSLSDPDNPFWDKLVMKLEELADKPQLKVIKYKLEKGTLDFGKDIHEVNVPNRTFKSWHKVPGEG